LWLTLLLKRALVEMAVQLGIGVAKRGQRGHAPYIFRKYSYFLLWEAFF